MCRDLPAKHKLRVTSQTTMKVCDYRTDKQTHGRTEAGQSYPYVPLCFAGDTSTKIL